MAIVLLYWIYLLVSTVSLGIGFCSLFKLKNNNPFILPFIGGFVIAILAGLWAIWGDLGGVFEITLGILSIASLLLNRERLKMYIFSLKAKLRDFPLFSQILLGLITVFAIAQSASAPYIIDNESYYIQTIKWLDTYGYVPGLANLHYFLGQQSGWHIFQSALNLNSISGLFNDINGFYLILGNAYAFDKLQLYSKSKQPLYLAASFLAVFNVFFFQFISSPSPDLPIFIITIILFTEFGKHYIEEEKEHTPILLLFILVIFAVYIKVIAIFLLPFPVLLYLKKKKQFKKDLYKLVLFSGLALIAFVVKNSIISGHPLYPLGLFKQDFDWTIPLQLQQYLVEATKSYAFFITPEQYEHMNIFERVLHWIRLPKLHGLFNKTIIVILLVFPLTLRNNILKKPYAVLYLLSIVQLLFLWTTSPQYRFYFGYLVILSCLLAAQVIKRKKLIQLILGLNTLIIIIPLFVPFSLREASNNEFNQELSSFSMAYIIKPHPITKYPDAEYKKLSFENFEYYTPTNIDFFWATGDCELPCVQKQQLMSFKEYFELAPQLLTQELKNGFKSVPFPNE